MYMTKTLPAGAAQLPSLSSSATSSTAMRTASTWGGLNAYNGRDIKIYKYSSNNDNSISNNIIRQIIESGDYLWIATDNGINRINKKTEQIQRYYLRNSPKKVPSTEKLYNIGKSSDGTIWGWLKDKGLFKFRNNKFERIPIDFTSKVKDLSITKSGAWFLLNNNVLKYIPINVNTLYLKEKSMKSIAGSVSKLFINDKQNIVQTEGTLIMEPTAEYEKKGFFGNVVFTNGQLVDGDIIHLYYGASDEVICQADLSIDKIFNSLK